MVDVFDARALDGLRWLGIPLLEGEDGVRLDHDLLAERAFLEGVRQNEVLLAHLTSSTTAVRVHAVAVDGRTRAEADANVTLEAQVVTAWELESVEARHERLLMRIIFPVAEDTGIGGATIGVCDFVLELALILHGLGHATSRKAAIDD